MNRRWWSSSPSAASSWIQKCAVLYVCVFVAVVVTLHNDIDEVQRTVATTEHDVRDLVNFLEDAATTRDREEGFVAQTERDLVKLVRLIEDPTMEEDEDGGGGEVANVRQDGGGGTEDREEEDSEEDPALKVSHPSSGSDDDEKDEKRGRPQRHHLTDQELRAFQEHLHAEQEEMVEQIMLEKKIALNRTRLEDVQDAAADGAADGAADDGAGAAAGEPRHSRYAYTFVLGGCDPKFPNYRGYLYGVLVSAFVLRQLGSRSDMYLFLEMHHQSAARTLPEPELRALRGLRITVVHVPSMPKPTFYQLQLQKFRALGLVQYKRVFHLDSDILPLSNLDYLMEYSDPDSDTWRDAGFSEPVLQENFVVTSPNDPSNGGNFMLTPHPGDLEKINDIIRAKERRVMSGIPWDVKTGWGVEIGTWNATLEAGVGWTFLAASGDQGLLYYWAKYVQQRLSVMAGYGRFETWVPGNATHPRLERVEEWPIPVQNAVHEWRPGRTGVRKDFFHFMGPNSKPWLKQLPDLGKETKMKSQDHYWQYCLMKINQKYRMDLDFTKLATRYSVPYVLAQSNFTSDAELTNLLDTLNITTLITIKKG